MNKKRNRFKLFIDRALSESIWKQILILILSLAVLFLVSLLLLLCSKSEWMSLCNEKHIHPILLPLYLLIDTNVLNTIFWRGHGGWMLVACTVIYVFGLVVCSGMIIGVITNYIGNRVAQHKKGLQYYVKSGHCIIMGYDDMVPSIIREIFLKMPKDTDVVLLTAMDAKLVTEKLQRSEVRDKMKHIFVTYGLSMVKDSYKMIHLESAEKIYIVGDRTLPAHDAINVECVVNISSYLKDIQSEHKPKRITCVFEDLDTYAAFKTTDIFSDLKEMNIDFIPYNFYVGWARQVFEEQSYRGKNSSEKGIPYQSVYGNGITPKDTRYVHLVFVGMSYFSTSFAMEAAHLLHFPNFDNKKSPRTRITFIEKNADEEMKIFTTRNRHFFEVQPYYYRDLTNGYYPQLQYHSKEDLLNNELEDHDFLDVEFEFIKGDAYSADVQTIIKGWAKDNDRQYLSIFLAMSNQRDNFTMGMNMPDEVYDNGIPVFIRQDRADDFVTRLRDTDDNIHTVDGGEVKYFSIENGKLTGTPRKGRYSNIYPFGMSDMAYYTDEKAFYQAKLINYLYQNSSENQFPDPIVLNALSDDMIWKEADDAWRELKVSERWSNLYAAYSLRCKMDSLRAMREMDKDDCRRDKDNLSETEVSYMARVEHNRWNVEKLLMGYRKAKPNEDRYIHGIHAKKLKSNKKYYFIHSDIRPFDKLDEVKKLDMEFAKYIPWIINMAERKTTNDEQKQL